jgi:hypothetical protein
MPYGLDGLAWVQAGHVAGDVPLLAWILEVWSVRGGHDGRSGRRRIPSYQTAAVHAMPQRACLATRCNVVRVRNCLVPALKCASGEERKWGRTLDV